MSRDHAAALALLDRITKGDWRWSDQYADTKGQRTWSLLGKGGYGILSCDGTANSPQGLGDVPNARAIAALPELAALYRAVVENWQLYEGNKGKYDFASIEKSEAVVSAALAAVADALTKGEGK